VNGGCFESCILAFNKTTLPCHVQANCFQNCLIAVFAKTCMFYFFVHRPIVYNVFYRTALAEAEIEYNDSYCSPSVYVRYQLQRLSDALSYLGNIICIVLLVNSSGLNHFLRWLRLSRSTRA